MGEAPPTGPLNLSVTPVDPEIGQTDVLTLTAHVTPVPEEPLTFEWQTTAQYGWILDGPPLDVVEEITSSGQSTVTYSAISVGNPGGTERVNVLVRNASGTELAEGFTKVTVAPPPAQIVSAVQVEFATEGDIPGRQNIWIVTAWPFDTYLGFSRYAFTVETPPGEGWDVGPVGTIRVLSLNNGLVDRDMLVGSYGSDLFDLGGDQWAYISGGMIFGEFDPYDPHDAKDLQAMRDHHARLTQLVYSVRPTHD